MDCVIVGSIDKLAIAVCTSYGRAGIMVAASTSRQRQVWETWERRSPNFTAAVIMMLMLKYFGLPDLVDHHMLRLTVKTWSFA